MERGDQPIKSHIASSVETGGFCALLAGVALGIGSASVLGDIIGRWLPRTAMPRNRRAATTAALAIDQTAPMIHLSSVELPRKAIPEGSLMSIGTDPAKLDANRDPAGGDVRYSPGSALRAYSISGRVPAPIMRARSRALTVLPPSWTWRAIAWATFAATKPELRVMKHFVPHDRDGIDVRANVGVHPYFLAR